MSALPAPLETFLLASTHPGCAWQRLRHGINFRLTTRLKTWRRAGHFRGITHLLDAGANEGAFARAWSVVCPETRAICFEPVPDTFRRLQLRCAPHPGVTPVLLGLGARSTTLRMNVGEFHEADSLLPMTDAHLRHWPASAASKIIDVEVAPLDDYLRRNAVTGRYFLKADVQGFELELLKGASATLPDIALIQIEISLVPLYQGAPDLPEVWKYLTGLGYRFLEVADVLISPIDQTPVSCDLLFGRIPVP